MTDRLLQDLVNRSPVGDAYYELILNNGIAEDCMILDANPAFEKIAGIKRELIIGKRASDVFREIETGGFDWINFFIDLSSDDLIREADRFVDICGKRFKVTVYSPEKLHFVAFFQETTENCSKKGPLHLLKKVFPEHTACMLIIEPLSGKIVDANYAACDFYGYTRDELLTMFVEDISPPFQEELKRRHTLMIQNHRYLLLPHRLKSGEIRMADVYSSPILYRDETYLFSIIFDITKRQLYKEDLYQKEELLRITFESIGDGVVTTNKEGLITSLNKAAQAITGWSEEDAKGKQFTDVFRLINEDTGEAAENPVEKVLQTGKIMGLANHTVLIHKKGCPVPVADSAAPIRNEAGSIFGVVMVFRDVSKEREQQEHILNLSYHDSLTGLFNRRYINEKINQLDVPEELPLAVIIGDVNGLKLTNDAFGHTEGDNLLIKVAKSLKESCRKRDVVARWGGDEFLIVLPGTSVKTVRTVIQRMQNTFSKSSEGMLQISVSLGYAVKENEGENFQDALKEAEKWMYHKKLLEGKSHRNAIVNTLLATLYENNIGTEEHSKRLESYCHAIGLKLNLSLEEQSALSLLAMLHDIGKVGIPRHILQKPGPLSPEEWEEIHRHCEIGYRIVQNTPELSTISEYILLHHERWDGKGYPRGYKEQEIPLLCRILAIADAYDVMTHGRAYQKACGRADAVAELKRNAGTQFDPTIVALFIELEPYLK